MNNSILEKFVKFQENYDEALSTINYYLNLKEDAFNYGIVSLAKWMMITDANPYAYLPTEWARHTESAERFVELLNYINHALYDDGEITFVTVNEEPRIVFAWKHDDNFRDLVLSDNEKRLENQRAVRLEKLSSEIRSKMKERLYDIEILDITPGEFGPLYDEYQSKSMKECFLHDAKRGIDWAAEHYRTYKCWNEDWIKEATEQSVRKSEEIK